MEMSIAQQIAALVGNVIAHEPPALGNKFLHGQPRCTEITADGRAISHAERRNFDRSKYKPRECFAKGNR